MKISEIRELTTEELRERLQADHRTYVETRINHSVSPLDKPSTLRDRRRTIARLEGELRERERKQNNQ